MTAPALGSSGRTYSLGAVAPHVRRAAELIGNLYGVGQILGWRATAKDMTGHPAGLALDVMVGPDKAKGDAINSYAHANAAALGLKYSIWWQTYYPVGGTPEPMADRGSDTQNHKDHPHLQFKATGGDGTPLSLGSASGTATATGGGVFDNWAGDLVGITLKLAMTAAAAAMVVNGLRDSVKKK